MVKKFIRFMPKIFCLSLLVGAVTNPLAPAAENQLWQKLQLPEAAQKQRLRGIYFLDAKRGWIVGDKGLCLRTNDGGAKWELQKTGTEKDLRCVYFRDPQTGWIGGEDHQLWGKESIALRTTDGGDSWKMSGLGHNFQITSIDASQAPLIHIGLSGGPFHPDGYVQYSTDGGKTWESYGKFCRGLHAIRAVDANRWVAVGSGVLCRFVRDDGSEVEFQFGNAWSKALNTEKACRAIYSEDGGKTWKVSKGSEAPQVAFLGIDFENDTSRVAKVGKGSPADKAGVRPGDMVMKLGDGKAGSEDRLDEALKRYKPGDKVPLTVQRAGKTITLSVQLEGRPASAFLWAMAVGKKQAVLAVGDRGEILRSLDAGSRWKKVPSPTTDSLRSVTWCRSWALAVGENGTAVLSQDDGKSWKSVATDRTETLNGVAAAGDYVIAVGDKGVALRAKVAEFIEPKKTEH